MKDFTRKRTRVLFQIEEDVFEAAPALPAETLNEFAGRYSGLGNVTDHRERFEIMAGVLELVLLPESYTLFRTRLKDREHPIELEQLSDVLVWLLEQYGLRPTQPSSSSSTGQLSQEPGTSLTDAPPPGESISLPSPQTVS